MAMDAMDSAVRAVMLVQIVTMTRVPINPISERIRSRARLLSTHSILLPRINRFILTFCLKGEGV